MDNLKALTADMEWAVLAVGEYGSGLRCLGCDLEVLLYVGAEDGDQRGKRICLITFSRRAWRWFRMRRS